jgi:hypothetical protein
MLVKLRLMGSGLLLLVAVLFFHSCVKSDIPPDFSKAKFTVKINCGGNAVLWDSLHCVNAAGNVYSLQTLHFYISNIQLKTKEGKVYNSNKEFYIDPSQDSKNFFQLDSIPAGNYSEMQFYIGLSPTQNISNALPNTTDNVNMAWPMMMGGGYHFMKMEGHFIDSSNVKLGYAIHLGKNENLVKTKVNCHLHQLYWNHEYSLWFDINEVFANPYLYNLDIEPAYTMSDSLAMEKIKNNMSDAFRVE